MQSKSLNLQNSENPIQGGPGGGTSSEIEGFFKWELYDEGGCISRHIDGGILDPVTGGRTTHTFIMYSYIRVPLYRGTPMLYRGTRSLYRYI